MSSLLQITERGLHCLAGGFYIDPWTPVERAVITHAHSDHARAGSAKYLTVESGVEVLRERVGIDAAIESLPYGEPIAMNGVRLSFHPAGHIMGSAQVRLEQGGEVCVVTGDYKRQADPSCAAFEPLPCHTLVTESTFGLPIYRWRDPAEVFAEINAWWRSNQERGRASVVFAYALGKAQRILAGVDASLGPIIVHGAVARFLPIYAAAGVRLPPVERASPEVLKATRGRALIVAPPSAASTPWLRKFGPASTALASGWMQIRGTRRRRGVDRGFVLSDHADWPGLMETIRDSGAQDVWVTHGYAETLAHWLREQGLNSQAIATRFVGEAEDEPEPTEPAIVEEP